MAKSFSEQIRRFAEKTNDTIDNVVADYAVGVSSAIIQRTPVGNPSLWEGKAPPGYVGGTARANWIPSIGQPQTSAIESTDDPSSKVTAIKEQIAGNVFYLTNNVPYIERLEYGWSTQAPKGMMRVSLREARKHLADAVNKNTRR